MKHFINLKDIPSSDLRKIIVDAKKRKKQRKKLSTLEVDKGSPLKGKMLIQMFEKASSRTRISFYLAIKQLGGGTLTLRSNELHLGQGGESIGGEAVARRAERHPPGRAWYQLLPDRAGQGARGRLGASGRYGARHPLGWRGLRRDGPDLRGATLGVGADRGRD